MKFNSPSPQPLPLEKITSEAVASVKLTTSDQKTIAKACDTIRSNLAEVEALSPAGMKAKAHSLVGRFRAGDENVTLNDVKSAVADKAIAKEQRENVAEAVAPLIAAAHDSIREIALRYQDAIETEFTAATATLRQGLEIAVGAFGEQVFTDPTARLEATRAQLADQRRQMMGDGPAGLGLSFLCGAGLAPFNPYRSEESFG